MKLVDRNDDREFSLVDLKRDWRKFRQEDPVNHLPEFKAEFFDILMATINGRNDLEIVGITPKEVSNYIIKLRKEVL